MKTIEGKITEGSPHSEIRYRGAHRICADCLSGSGAQRYKALALSPPVNFASYDGYCYVCEEKRHVAVVEAIQGTVS